MLLRLYEAKYAEQNWEAVHSLQAASVIVHLTFILDHVVYFVFI
jgi:hypothetical protein